MYIHRLPTPATVCLWSEVGILITPVQSVMSPLSGVSLPDWGREVPSYQSPGGRISVFAMFMCKVACLANTWTPASRLLLTCVNGTGILCTSVFTWGLHLRVDNNKLITWCNIYPRGMMSMCWYVAAFLTGDITSQRMKGCGFFYTFSHLCQR